MRFLPVLFTAAFALVPAHAWAHNSSAPFPATPAAQAANVNPFVAPPGATVTLEVDARDGDLLGMVKDLLSGLTKPTTPGAPSGGKAMEFMGPFGNMQLDTILKEVTHLHLIQYKKATTPDVGSALAQAVKADALGFYEKQFIASGGRRLLYSGQGTRVVIIGFDVPKGMAFITEDASSVTVGQLDGTINVKPLATILLGFMGMGESMETVEPVPVTAPVKKPTAPPARPGAKTLKKSGAR